MPSIRRRLLLWLLPGLAVLWALAGTAVYQSVKRAELDRLDSKLRTMENPARMIAFTLRSPAPGQRDNAPPATGAGPRNEEDRARRPSRQDGQGDREGDRSADRQGADLDRPDQRPSRPDPKERWPEFYTPGGGLYFEITGDNVASPVRSPSLSEQSLPLPAAAYQSESGAFESNTLADGTPVRIHARVIRGLGRGRRSNSPGPRMIGAFAVNMEPVNQTLSSLLLGIVATGIIAGLASAALVALALRNGLRPVKALGDQVAAINARSLGQRFSGEGIPAELSPISGRLNELMERLESSFERERRFSADLAHELRTPVAELKTMAEVALKWPDGNDPEQHQQTLDIANQMGGIIESLLALGRFENGQAKLEPEPVNIAALCESAWRPFAEKATERGVSIDFNIPEQQTFKTDPEMLRVIISNLLSNAAEYTPSGSTISVQGAVSDDGTVLSVANSTDNLDEGAVGHLFERFWRRDGSRTDNSHSGLGLSLARACSRALSLQLQADLEASNLLVFSLKQRPAKDSGTSSSANLAPLS